ncbi:MAG: VWA domain-containing protein, partial [Pseudomonadota bacterium]|nr:VWA domain-containing protein [Pseudomonadota bacterium]
MAKLPTSTEDDVSAFLRKVSETPAPAAGEPGERGRLIFAMDATASREPTWDQACQIQGEMFS